MKALKNDQPTCTENLLAMRDTLDILGGKWKLLILHYLITRESQTNTFKKIQREVLGISAKVLTKELKDLEENKLVEREELDTKPKMVEYRITDYGKSSKQLIQQLVYWGKNHRYKMLQS
ncbi:helix-turn-helix domain-containing protein [Sphingobacterium sp. 1.A.5]|uniref:winged helix-turn-helix transcriptional regulator n=1 Tax=Sphingobacterium sp. 1.A.5 TaxID=2044604 RepID=UPI000C0BE6EB|nr:helix-turn-helix domain-containing protein [Sphingobacterium sp. 1.A.5]